MFSVIQSITKKISVIIQSSFVQFTGNVLLIIILLVLLNQAFADSGADPLKGMFGGLTATMSSGGAGRTAAFVIEGIVGTATFIKSKNLLMMFGAPLAIEIFLQLVMKLAGA